MSGQLEALLGESQQQGFIGPVDLAVHIQHAQGFAAAIPEAEVPGRVLDLGSGGGLPALVLADRWTSTSFWLVEASQRKAGFLARAVEELGWAGRVVTLHGRAEDFGLQADLRASVDLVTARGFGPPGVTAECAAPFLRVGGRLVVSEPPRDDVAEQLSRWPVDGLQGLGMVGQQAVVASGGHFAVLGQVAVCSDRYPRRVGIPAKRPLF